MTQEEDSKYLKDLEDKAIPLVGTWICEKGFDSIYFVHDYYVSEAMCDVVLECFYLPQVDYVTIPKRDEVYMSEFKEYFKSIPPIKGEAIWTQIRSQLDDLFYTRKSDKE